MAVADLIPKPLNDCGRRQHRKLTRAMRTSSVSTLTATCRTPRHSLERQLHTPAHLSPVTPATGSPRLPGCAAVVALTLLCRADRRVESPSSTAPRSSWRPTAPRHRLPPGHCTNGMFTTTSLRLRLSSPARSARAISCTDRKTRAFADCFENTKCSFRSGL